VVEKAKISDHESIALYDFFEKKIRGDGMKVIRGKID